MEVKMSARQLLKFSSSQCLPGCWEIFVANNSVLFFVYRYLFCIILYIIFDILLFIRSKSDFQSRILSKCDKKNSVTLWIVTFSVLLSSIFCCLSNLSIPRYIQHSLLGTVAIKIAYHVFGLVLITKRKREETRFPKWRELIHQITKILHNFFRIVYHLTYSPNCMPMSACNFQKPECLHSCPQLAIN